MVIMTGTVVKKEFFKSGNAPASRAPEPVKNWTAYLAAGSRIGPSNAPITILEFGDFQCPACRYFATTLWPNVRTEFGDKVSLVFRHWPLSYHKHAYQAAVAAECAAMQGRLEQFHDLLFLKQDSIGLKSMRSFATDARVRDIDAFDRCASRNSPVESIEGDIAAARAAGGTGTPTLVINGMRYPLRRDSLWLNHVIDSLLSAGNIGSARR
jgi:protein-disulfide isomerase